MHCRLISILAIMVGLTSCSAISSVAIMPTVTSVIPSMTAPTHTAQGMVITAAPPPSSVPTSTASSTVTLSPSALPAPTATQEEHHGPGATPITRKDDRAASLMYIDTIAPISAELHASLHDISLETIRREKDSSLLQDANWKHLVYTYASLIHDAHARFQAIQSMPASFQDYHALMLRATQECNDAMDNMVKRINATDPGMPDSASLSLATKQLSHCRALIRLAAEKLPK